MVDTTCPPANRLDVAKAAATPARNLAASRQARSQPRRYVSGGSRQIRAGAPAQADLIAHFH
jgi:hypothetical protein